MISRRTDVQYCAKVTQANFYEFLGFPWLFEEINFASNEISVTFPRTFKAPIVLILPHFRTIIQSGRYRVPKFRGKGRSFRSVAELSKENSLWLLRVLIQTERNTASVRDLLLCKETQRTFEIRFINSINCYIDLTC